jgi:catechol 2,3-dioxygenase-like lactoylglutathione lyase family enzyme
MAVHLNHTIVASRDQVASSEFLAALLGLDAPKRVSHFMALELANGVTLDYDDVDHVTPQHFAFLVTDAEFDAIFLRVEASAIQFYADPNHGVANAINHRNGGRGFYFSDPDGHNLEVFTIPPL